MVKYCRCLSALCKPLPLAIRAILANNSNVCMYVKSNLSEERQRKCSCPCSFPSAKVSFLRLLYCIVLSTVLANYKYACTSHL